MTTPSNGSSSNWQSRVHQVEFTPAQIKKLKDADQQDQSSLHDVLIDLAVDNQAIRIKSVEFHGNYTFGVTLDKRHPKYPSHTWWFYDNDLGRGIRVLRFFVQHMLSDWIAEDTINDNGGLW